MTFRGNLATLMRRYVVPFLTILNISVAAHSQETTGGLRGIVKDPEGAVVVRAQVVVTGSTLLGKKETETDASGRYRFANLPPGVYSVTVMAAGFRTVKRGGMPIEVGNIPSIDFTLEVGAADTVVEVVAETPDIDPTTAHTLTTVTQDTLREVPRGSSYQSVIQFAPAARNEPLAGNNVLPNTAGGKWSGGQGTGGAAPGSNANGRGFGFQVAGGADSENRYLIEGQDTANVLGGYSHTDVPFDFIHEVQVKTSGMEAEYGGAMGGVVNVIMKRASNSWHGSLGLDFQADALNANQNTPFLRYDPRDAGVIGGGNFPLADPRAQTYQQDKDHFRFYQPAFTAGGPILKDRIQVFLGVAPKYLSIGRIVDFSASNGAVNTFNQDQRTYFTTARVDATLSRKVRIFSSWLYQFQRETGAVLPFGDSNSGLFNLSSTIPLTAFKEDYGFAAPNQTANFGLDLVLTPNVIATTRFGYFFENYHDFGYPNSGTVFSWVTPGSTGPAGTGGINDNAGATLPISLQQPRGYFSDGVAQNFAFRNASKHYQFDQDIAWYKSGWMGSHNFKFGYQLNRMSNDISQHASSPTAILSVGQGNFYSFAGSTGAANCEAYVAGGAFGKGDIASGTLSGCAGQYGFLNVMDFGTYGYSSSVNHSFYAQDAWNIGKGVTINAGVRIENEYLPATPVRFGWGDKIAPRLGAAWDVFRNGKIKVFGGYSVYNDLMKLTLAATNFGGQYWNYCYYGLDTSNLSTIKLEFDSASRYCSGESTDGAKFAGGSTPSGLTFLENQNLRSTASPDPELKPYRQHESVFGTDYTVVRNLILGVRWDRRRLDRAIEDSAVFDSTGSETFQVVNPGFGANATNLSFSCTDPSGPGCPLNIKAERSYDGLETRLTWSGGQNWSGTVSYTYSKLRGNYSGLTSTDLSDGGGGRNAPNLSRAFDESYFQFDAYGRSSNGPLGSDRPHAIKGYGDYRKTWLGGRTSTTIGWFQTFYSGTPKSSFVNVGFAFAETPYAGGFPVYPEGRGKWANISLSPNSDGIMIPNVTSVCECRTPWFIQSDLSLRQEFKFNPHSETQVFAFEATVSNLFNRSAPTAYYSQIDSANFQSFLVPGGEFSYAAFEHAYDWKSQLSKDGIVGNSQYGQPLYYQQARSIRLGIRYTF